MTIRTPEEVYQAVLHADAGPEVRPIIEQLRAAGAFSSRAAALIRHMQQDESFRQRCSNENTLREIARSNNLPSHETVVLVCAAVILDPRCPWTDKPWTLRSAPSPEDLAAKYKTQELNFTTVRQDRVNLFLKQMKDDEEFTMKLWRSPAMVLGNEDLTRSEFFWVCFWASLLLNMRKKTDGIVISPEFIACIGLGAGEVTEQMNKLLALLRGG